MKFIHYLFLFLLGMAVILTVAFFQDSPGYMDADYYFAGGLRLAQGHGFTETFLWNYLDMPEGIPHPSHIYWMPLPSILAMIGMSLSGVDSFSMGRLGFLVLAGFIPVVTGALAYSLTAKKKHALLAGTLAAIPCFYTSFLGTTDSFGIYMLLGGLFFLLIGLRQKIGGHLQALLLGIVAGFMHMTRADGILWLLLAMLSVVIIALRLNRDNGTKKRSAILGRCVQPVLICLVGYAIVVTPWMVRNVNEFGAVFASSGMKSLWLTEYNELYAFPPAVLNPARWIASGVTAILDARLYALWQNLQSAIVVQGGIFLTPLVVAGLWYYRRDLRIQIGGLGWLITFLAMSILFPFVGWRGGFFHSGAAFQPLFWSLAPVGLDIFIEWGVKHRGWVRQHATAVFTTCLLIFSILLSGYLVSDRVIGSDYQNPAWGDSTRRYVVIDNELNKLGAVEDEIVLVNNAPGYYVATRRSAISIPDGDLDTTLRVAKKYGGKYLIIEENHPPGLDQIYQSASDRPGIEYLATIGSAHIFRIAE